MTDRPQSLVQRAAPGLLAAGVPFCVYLRTLAPTVYGLDSAELTTGAYALGIVHAPGSPLYLLIGHLFTYLPIGDVGYRLNFMSACAAALTTYFVYAILLRLTASTALAVVGAWLLSFSYYFWTSALIAELYPVHACFFAGLLLLALKWRDRGQPRDLYLVALGFGLGLGVHLSLILMAPGFVWLAFTGRADLWKQGRTLFIAGTLVLVGASVYAYLPIRYLSDTPLNYARDYWGQDLATPEGFWWMVSGQMFRQLVFAIQIAELPSEIATYVGQLRSNFLWLGLVLGLVGVASDIRDRPGLHAALGLMFTAHLVFFLSYGAPDKQLMLLPTYVIWTVWMGLGASWLVPAINRLLPEDWALSPATLVALVALSCLVLNFERADVSDDWEARELGESKLDALPPNAVFIGNWTDAPILEYLTIVEKIRPDITPLMFVGTAGGAIAANMMAEGRPVFTSDRALLRDQPLTYEYSPDCRCHRVWPREAGHDLGKLNVVMIVVDTLRADALSSYGYHRPTSPRIDRLTAKSIQFRNAISVGGDTPTAMAGIMTGRLPFFLEGDEQRAGTLTGMQRFYTEPWEHGLPWGLETMAEVLKDQGYATAGIVTNPNLAPLQRFDQGFDEYYAVYPPKGSHPPYVRANQVSDAGLAFLKSNRREPFFLYLHYMDPHAPYDPPPQFRYLFDFETIPNRSFTNLWFDWATEANLEAPENRHLKEHMRGLYDSEIAYTDAAIGTVLDHLDAAGLRDRTIIVFTSDHGEEFLEHGGTEHKGPLYDEIVGIPMVLHIPGRPPATIDALVRNFDLMPTLLDFLGIDPPAHDLDAVSLRPLIDGDADELDVAVFANFPNGLKDGPQRMLRTDRHKLLVRLGDESRNQLFDLVADPRETSNIYSADRSGALQELRTKLDEIVTKLDSEEPIPHEYSGLSRPDAIPPGRSKHPPDELVERMRALGYFK